ncbi:hypothetical protein [Streptomyces endophyticus]|uniref:Uncharacterized protein n=1 Tax=Streptomyces endophyticus TaxID=714166 RepID=A0ABU6F8J5_9ACTN|nr:hypothetical protein [Streptomyces endophyticus]MEB8340342.1 hypothetical protein [Streptomyces endophyticus]
MSFFARASWPGDHRDEVVAGALAAAVVIVLGYASGIGAQAEQTTTGSAPPTVEAPASPSTPSSPDPAPAETPGADSGGDGAGNPGVLPVGGIPAGGTEGTGEAAGNHEHDNSSGLPDDSGHSGHTSPTPSSPPPSTPSPSPSSPSASPSCAPGEVRLVQPLLKGALTPVTGLLEGLTDGGARGDGAASDEKVTPCVGLASDPALLTELTP